MPKIGAVMRPRRSGVTIESAANTPTAIHAALPAASGAPVNQVRPAAIAASPTDQAIALARWYARIQASASDARTSERTGFTLNLLLVAGDELQLSGFAERWGLQARHQER